MGPYTCTHTFPYKFLSLGTYSGKTLQIISIPTCKIFCDIKKQILLAKTLWICDFHSLWQLWTFSPMTGGTTAQILSTSEQLHLLVLLVSLSSKNSFAFLLISLWFHSFFRFTLGSCFPSFLFISISCETSPKSHPQSLLSLIRFNMEISQLPPTLRLDDLSSFVWDRGAMEVPIYLFLTKKST